MQEEPRRHDSLPGLFVLHIDTSDQQRTKRACAHENYLDVLNLASSRENRREKRH